MKFLACALAVISAAGLAWLVGGFRSDVRDERLARLLIHEDTAPDALEVSGEAGGAGSAEPATATRVEAVDDEPASVELTAAAPTSAEVDELVGEMRKAAREGGAYRELKPLLARLHALDTPAARAAMADLLTDFSFEFTHRAMTFSDAVPDPCALVRRAAMEAAEIQVRDGFNSGHHLGGYVEMIGRGGGAEDAAALEELMRTEGAAAMYACAAVSELEDRSLGADFLRLASSGAGGVDSRLLFQSLARWDDGATTAGIESAVLDPNLSAEVRAGALEALARSVEVHEISGFASRYYSSAGSEDERLVAVRSWSALNLSAGSDFQQQRCANAMQEPLRLALTDDSHAVKRAALQFLRNRDGLMTADLAETVRNSPLADSTDGRAVLALWERTRAHDDS